MEQKKDTSGKIGEIQKESGLKVIVMYQCWFLSLTAVPWSWKRSTTGEIGEGCVRML